MNYHEFIEQKKHSVIDFGIKANFIPDKMFDFQKVSMGRKAIGIELKESYFKQAIMNLKDVKARFQFDTQSKLF